MIIEALSNGQKLGIGLGLFVVIAIVLIIMFGSRGGGNYKGNHRR